MAWTFKVLEKRGCVFLEVASMYCFNLQDKKILYLFL